jgi:membrane-associated phospholipid phosphatase
VRSRYLFGLVLAGVLIATRPARADEPTDSERAAHLAGMVVAGGFYLTMEFPLKYRFSSPTCSWCVPPRFDSRVREALRWEKRQRARLASDIIAFAGTPIMLSIMMAGAGPDLDERRLFDDLAPMVESAILVSLMQSTLKYVTKRARPFVQFAPPGRKIHHDDNTAFWSGHTSAVFAETVACGIVAHRRGYDAEPVIWISGITLGVVTSYLRMSADMHYASDVAVGTLLGIGVGIAVPLLLHPDDFDREEPAVMSRTPRIFSVGGRF